MIENDTGKRRLPAILPTSTLFIIVDIVLLLVFSVLVVVRRDIGTIWAVMMIPVLIAALFYPRRTYGIMLGIYVLVSYSVITLESPDKFASYQETTAFLLAVVMAGEILYRLTEARRKVEEALLKSEQRFRSLSATAPVGIFETDENGNLSYTNSRFRSIFGSGTGDGAGRQILETVVNHEDHDSIIAAWKKALSEGRDYSAEIKMSPSNGDVRWIDVQATPIVAADGAIKSYVGTVEDITGRKRSAEMLKSANDRLEERVRLRTDELTAAIEKLEQEIIERKQTEDALRQSEERFSKAFLASPAAISINRKSDGRFISVNEAYLNSIGYPESEVLGRTGSELGISSPLEEQESLAEKLAVEGSVRNVEMSFPTRWGEPHVALVSIEPIEIAGEPCWLNIATDITERIDLERQLQDYAESLNRLLNQLMNAQEAERRRLAMDIHDGPLQSLGVSLLALDRAIRRLEREEFEVVDRELRYLRTTLAGTVSEVRAVLADLSLEVLTTYGLVFALRGHAERFADVTGINVQLVDEISRRPAPEIELLMYRLAQEALANVRKHAHAQSISVSLFERDNRLHLVISDDGRGFRVRTAMQQHHDGDRLGLRSMLQRVQAMGGDLQITSAPGEGATLEFWCPLGSKQHSDVELSREQGLDKA